MPAVREDAIAAWRRAEARVYPTVMVNAAIYEQYLTMVRAVADELADVRTEDELVTAWDERRELASAVVARHAPSLRALMDLEAVRDAAFCHRHREITRERGKEIARERLEQARREQAEWVVLFDDVTPLGSHRLEMHVRSGRALHASCQLDVDRARDLHAGGRPARSGHRHVAARQAAADAGPDLSHARGVGGAHRPGAGDVRKGLTMATTHPQRIIDAHCHIGEIPPWKFYDLEHPVKPTVYDYRSTAGVRQEPHGRVQDRARARDVQLRRAGARDLVRPQRRRDGRGDDQRPHPRRDLGLVPAAQRGDDAQGAEARLRVARRGAEDDVPARRQPRPRDRGTTRRARSPTSASTSARSTTSSSTSTRARAATRTSRTSSRSSSATASAARSTSCTSAAGCRATSGSSRSSCSGCRTATRSTPTPRGRSASARAGC